MMSYKKNKNKKKKKNQQQQQQQQPEILPVGQRNIPKPKVPLGDEGDIREEHFKNLGAYCSADGTVGTFRLLDSIWKDRYISLLTKMLI